MKEVFSDIIKNRKWKKHICGPGSTMEYTENIRKELIPLVTQFNIKTILDVPCGDFSWMSTVNFPADIKYTGGDIVDFMIEENKQRYLDKDFRVIDLTIDDLPDADLLICRDCLLHLTFKDIDKVFKNISKSNIKYILTSNWFDQFDNNKDIETGKGRGINFLLEPYNFSDVLYSITDYIEGFPRREMLLWNIDTIKTYVKEKNL